MGTSFRSNFTDVDQSADPRAHVGYLDLVRGQDAVQAYKQQSHALLDLHPGDRVLDVGCGAGEDVLALAKIVAPGGHVVGLDSSATMVEEARRLSEGDDLPIEFVVGDAHNLDFPDKSFDGARADRVFQHLDNPLKALIELMRVTKPGGMIVVMDPDWGALIVDGPDQETTQAVLTEQASSIRNPWMGRQLLGLFHRAGMADVTIIARATLLRDYQLANHVFHLSESLSRLQANGKVTSKAARNWITSLEAAHPEGRFCCALTAFTVAGRSP